QAGDANGLISVAAKHAAEGEVVGWIVDADAAVAGIGNEQVAADRSEPRRRHDHTRGRIERTSRGDPPEQLAATAVYVHEALAPAVHEAAVLRGVSLGVRHKQLAADVLDAVRGVPLGQVSVLERAGQMRFVELAVDHVDLAVMEIGRVEEVRVADVAYG